MKKMSLMNFGKISVFIALFLFTMNVSADVVDTGKYSIKEISFSSEKNTNFINNLWYATKDLSTKEDLGNVSKNLFPGWLIGKGLNANTGVLTTWADGAVSTEYIPVDFSICPDFYLSGLSPNLRTFVAAYNINNVFLGRTDVYTKTGFSFNEDSFKYGVAQGTGVIAYLRITSYILADASTPITEINNINTMLNEGDTPLPYEQYKKETYKKYVDYNVSDYKDLVFKNFSVSSKQNLSLRFEGSSTNYTYSISSSTLKKGKYQPLYTMDDDYNNEYGTIDEYYIDDTHSSNPKLARITDRTNVEFNSSIQDRDLIYTYAYYIPNNQFIQLTPEDTPLEKFETWLGCNTLYNHYYDDNYMDKPRFINDTAQCITSMKSLGNLNNSGRDNIETFQDSMISISSNNKIYAVMKLYNDGSLVSTLSTSMITRYVPVRFEHKSTGEWKDQGWALKFEIFGVYDDVEFDSIQTEINLNGHLVTYKSNSQSVISYIKWGEYKIISLTTGQSMKQSLLSKTEQLKNFIIKIFKYVPILGDIVAILIEIIFSIIDILIIIADMFASLPLWLYQGLGIVLICIIAKIIKEVSSG